MDEAKVQQDMTLIQQLMNFWLDLLRTEVESCGNVAAAKSRAGGVCARTGYCPVDAGGDCPKPSPSGICCRTD